MKIYLIYFGNYLDGTYIKMDPDPELPGIEIFDKMGLNLMEYIEI